MLVTADFQEENIAMADYLNSHERLAPYYEAARQEAAEPKRLVPVDALKAFKGVSFSAEEFASALGGQDDVAVIAEHKRRSPSEGDIRSDSTIGWTVAEYCKGGAVAISVLTEGPHFGGSINDILDARRVTAAPILRKDFLSNEYQLHEARAYNADAVLLIAAGLSDKRLKQLYDEAGRIGLECLIEVHNSDELARALNVEPTVIGVNNRNLSTLQVDIDIAQELIPAIPEGIITVAESGYSVRKPEHIRQLRELGADAVIMGTALMREESPADALAAWLATD